jgi:cadmium resistance protein CadD (predicted permease)
VMVYVAIFLAMTLLLCATAFYFVTHPASKTYVARYGKLIFPYAMIALGLYILSDLLPLLK